MIILMMKKTNSNYKTLLKLTFKHLIIAGLIIVAIAIM
jgi:hypothetical protein